MIDKTRARIGFVVVAAVGIAVVACGSIADLDVKYDSVGAGVDGSSIDPTSASDAGRVLRDSSFVEPDAAEPVVLEPSDAGPCNASTDPDGGCDFTQGLGCCIRPGGTSECIFQWEIATKCQNSLFVGCREDDPLSESACCWRSGPSNTRMSVLAVSCDGGTHACLVDGGACPGAATCNESVCPIAGGSFPVGTCGAASEACP